MLTADDIRDALRACFDPEIPLDVMELGILRGIALTVDEEAPGFGIAGVPLRQRLRVELAPTTSDDDRRAQLLAQVANRLAGLPQISRAEVVWVEQSAWTPGQITPAGRRLLGLDRAVFPILNNRIPAARGGV